jgi:hypothetical protein
VKLAVNSVQQAILFSYHQKCPVKLAFSPRRVPWWSKELNHLKASTRQICNKVKKTGDWESLKMPHTNYHKEIRKFELSSRRDYFWGIENVPYRTGLRMIMASQLVNRVSCIKLLDS